MADEHDIDRLGEADRVAPLDPDKYTVLVPQDAFPNAYSKYPLHRLVLAAHDGDLELLQQMLNRDDPINGYHHDINAHHEEERINALHAAALNGQIEAVEMLLAAGADPHVRQTMPHGKDPRDGETAREMADRWGWDDIEAVLRKAEETTPKGVYLRYGTGNNSKLWPVTKPEGLDPQQERRARLRHQRMLRPLPSRGERKYYGDMVFGVTHGWDGEGKVIRPAPFGQEEALPRAASSRAGLLFPDDRAQRVGMMARAPPNARVREMARVAERVLGYDLLALCADGPAERLNQVEVAQPAIYLASLAALETLREQRPEAAERPEAVAGMALGEFAALTAAGVMSFEMGLKLVQERAAAMTEAAKQRPHRVMSVAGLDKEEVRRLCAEVSAQAGQEVYVTAELFPKACLCAGTSEAVEQLKQSCEKDSAVRPKVLDLPAAHTPLMQSARNRLEASVAQCLPNLRPPHCDVYMCASGACIRAGTDPAAITKLLCEQLTSCAMWEGCMRGMVAAGVQEIFELGPKGGLKNYMKRIDQEAWGRTENIEQ